MDPADLEAIVLTNSMLQKFTVTDNTFNATIPAESSAYVLVGIAELGAVVGLAGYSDLLVAAVLKAEVGAVLGLGTEHLVMVEIDSTIRSLGDTISGATAYPFTGAYVGVYATINPFPEIAYKKILPANALFASSAFAAAGSQHYLYLWSGMYNAAFSGSESMTVRLRNARLNTMVLSSEM
jgi:hypothetical protein